jgi:hypothetical protein|tara:strand:+ start:7409 stop:7633 length:225 start_codon:yes stop_codon:yes gene_type:complete
MKMDSNRIKRGMTCIADILKVLKSITQFNWLTPPESIATERIFNDTLAISPVHITNIVAELFYARMRGRLAAEG